MIYLAITHNFLNLAAKVKFMSMSTLRKKCLLRIMACGDEIRHSSPAKLRTHNMPETHLRGSPFNLGIKNLWKLQCAAKIENWPIANF